MEKSEYFSIAFDHESVYIKTAAVIDFFGGLRSTDLLSIKLEDFEFYKVIGMCIIYLISKQPGETSSNEFNELWNPVLIWKSCALHE